MFIGEDIRKRVSSLQRFLEGEANDGGGHLG